VVSASPASWATRRLAIIAELRKLVKQVGDSLPTRPTTVDAVIIYFGDPAGRHPTKPHLPGPVAGPDVRPLTSAPAKAARS